MQKLRIIPLPFFGSAVSFYLSYKIADGTALKYVHFAGVDNEIFCGGMLFAAGFFLLFSSFTTK